MAINKIQTAIIGLSLCYQFFCKILKKIFEIRLMSYLEEFKLISKHQLGFRPGIGTKNAL